MRANACLAILFVSAATSGCVALGPRDEMCLEIVRFANAGNGDPQAVRLTTDWGGVWSKEEVMFEKNCEHGGYGPGQKLCDYLMKNTSSEFAAININRALSCISAPRIPESSDAKIELRYVRAKIEARKMKGLSAGILVGVEYSHGFTDKPPSLRISARPDN